MSGNDIAVHPAAVAAALLRCELSAVEAYEQAIGRFEGKAAAATLARLRDDHRAAATALRDRITAHGDTPPADDCHGGAFQPAAAAGVGPAAVLYALKRGEDHVLGEYEAALADPDVDPACKNLIRADLFPAAHSRVVDLDHMLAGK